jgi:hypothetical protein
LALLSISIAFFLNKEMKRNNEIKLVQREKELRQALADSIAHAQAF